MVKKFKFSKIALYLLLGGVAFVFDRPKCVVNLLVTNVADGFVQKFIHPFLIEVLQSIDKIKVIVVSHAFPIKFQVGCVVLFVDKFA